MKTALLFAALALGSGCKQFDDYQTRGKRSEAELQLHKLGKNLQGIVIDQEKFPILTLGPTPAQPCCTQPKAQCAPDPAPWNAWVPLDFAISDPFRFQYTYSSTDGKTFVATATGDLDCDTDSIVYKLTGVLENGAAKTTVERPTTPD